MLVTQSQTSGGTHPPQKIHDSCRGLLDDPLEQNLLLQQYLQYNTVDGGNMHPQKQCF